MPNPQPAPLPSPTDDDNASINSQEDGSGHLEDFGASASVQKSLPLNQDDDYYYYRSVAHVDSDANFGQRQGADDRSDSGNSNYSHEERHYSDDDSVDHLSVLMGGDAREMNDDDHNEIQKDCGLDGNSRKIERNSLENLAYMQMKNENIDFNSSWYDGEERDYFADQICTPSFDQNKLSKSGCQEFRTSVNSEVTLDTASTMTHDISCKSNDFTNADVVSLKLKIAELKAELQVRELNWSAKYKTLVSNFEENVSNFEKENIELRIELENVKESLRHEREQSKQIELLMQEKITVLKKENLKMANQINLMKRNNLRAARPEKILKGLQQQQHINAIFESPPAVGVIVKNRRRMSDGDGKRRVRSDFNATDFRLKSVSRTAYTDSAEHSFVVESDDDDVTFVGFPIERRRMPTSCIESNGMCGGENDLLVGFNEIKSEVIQRRPSLIAGFIDAAFKKNASSQSGKARASNEGGKKPQRRFTYSGVGKLLGSESNIQRVDGRESNRSMDSLDHFIGSKHSHESWIDAEAINRENESYNKARYRKMSNESCDFDDRARSDETPRTNENGAVKRISLKMKSLECFLGDRNKSYHDSIENSLWDHDDDDDNTY